MTTSESHSAPRSTPSSSIIDAQVHVYEPDHPRRPWKGRLPGPDSMTGDEMVSAMNNAGVDKALIVSSWAFYHADASYAAEVHQAHSDRFRIIAPINPYVAGAVEAVTAWGETPGAVGIRVMPGVIDGFDAEDAEVRAVVGAAGQRDFPICVYCPGQPELLDQLATLYPNTLFVLDHLGLPTVFKPPPPPDPFAGLDSILALAKHDNVAVKVTAACTLAHQPFPFEDLWAPLERYFDAFGIERCMWGTDWTRAVDLVSYPESVASFRDHLPVTADERAALMGGVLERTFRW